MKSRRCFLASLVAVLLCAGCTVTVGGKALPAGGRKPRPLTGQTVNRVLLDDSALSKLLHQPLVADPHFPPQFGGPETLRGDRSASPADCLGVAAMLQRGVYHSANVENVAVGSWTHGAWSMKVIGVKEGVVSLPTASDADALFAKFSRQWQNCDGTTLPMPGSVLGLTPRITNVRVADSLVAADVSMQLPMPGSRSLSIPEGRAIGVRGNCLVEVEVDFFATPNPSRQGSGAINNSAIDVAHTMMDRVSALS